jgi:hypothetical protein
MRGAIGWQCSIAFLCFLTSSHDFSHDYTGQDTTTCAFKRESAALLGRFHETAALTGASIFRTGGMMTARSDSRTSRHYLDGLPQTHLPAFG